MRNYLEDAYRSTDLGARAVARPIIHFYIDAEAYVTQDGIGAREHRVLDFLASDSISLPKEVEDLLAG